jgi:hypothetical protein
MDGHDDPVATRREGVACDWRYRHAEGLSVEREGWFWTPRCPIVSNGWLLDFAAAKIVDIALTSSSTARFSPVDSQESQVSILRASRHVFGLTRNTLPFQDVRSGLSAWFVHRIF